MTLDLTQFEGHTPGPWMVEKSTNAEADGSNPWSHYRMLSGAKFVCALQTYGDTDTIPAEVSATWRLLAAAPALLKQLTAERLVSQAKIAALEQERDSAVRERVACHELYDAILRLCEHDPAKGHSGVMDAVQAALQASEQEVEALRTDSAANLVEMTRLALEVGTLKQENSKIQGELEEQSCSLSPAMVQARNDQLNAQVERLERELAEARRSAEVDGYELVRLRARDQELSQDVERLTKERDGFTATSRDFARVLMAAGCPNGDGELDVMIEWAARVAAYEARVTALETALRGVLEHAREFDLEFGADGMPLEYSSCPECGALEGRVKFPRHEESCQLGKAFAEAQAALAPAEQAEGGEA